MTQDILISLIKLLTRICFSDSFLQYSAGQARCHIVASKDGLRIVDLKYSVLGS